MGLTTAVLCLALNIYYEARGELTAGQEAVALVTMNRADWEPRNICKEVYRPGQFSWTARGNEKPQEREAWRNAQRIATSVVNGEVNDFTDGATFFHVKGAAPGWRRKARYVMTLGNHHFYKSI